MKRSSILYRYRYEAGIDVSSPIHSSGTAAALTQLELARRAGTSQPAIARYEAGVSSPSVATLERILRATGQRLELGLRPTTTAHDASSVRMRALRARRREILAEVRAAGARNVRIFGSVARGDDTTGSAIDFLVDGNSNQSSLLVVGGLTETLTQLLGQQVDVWSVDLIKKTVADQANTEAVAL